MEHSKALMIAEWLVDELRPFCERIEIAGSLRRGKAEVHDMEIVAMPTLKAPVPVFGSKEIDKTWLDRGLREMCDPLLGSSLRRIKGGDKFKQFEFTRWVEFGLEEPIKPFKLDLFLVTPPAQWGVQLVIRTGPAEFSQWVVTQRAKGGALPDGYCVKDGAVWAVDLDETPIGICSLFEEMDFLDFLGLGWVEPRDRRARWHGH